MPGITLCANRSCEHNHSVGKLEWYGVCDRFLTIGMKQVCKKEKSLKVFSLNRSEMREIMTIRRKAKHKRAYERASKDLRKGRLESTIRENGTTTFKYAPMAFQQGTRISHISIMEIPKVIPRFADNTYHFRGPINFQHLCFECLNDKKQSFLALSKDTLYYGLYRTVPEEAVKKLQSLTNSKRTKDTYLPYHVFACDKRSTTILMKELPELPKSKSVRRKLAKKLYKAKKAGDFSNKPETKVMVF